MKLKRKKRLLMIIITIVILIPVIVVLLIINTNPFQRSPDELTITIAWNPGSTADDVVRAMSREISTNISLHNVVGANGANGANAVYRSLRNGSNVLSTNLSAFVTSEAMGFAESSPRDWEVWLLAFSPAVIIVADDSPYQTIDDLIADIRANPSTIRCADDGYGTIGFTAAELFSSQIVLEVHHESFSGEAQAIDAVLNNQADFAILLGALVAENIRSGLLRELGAINDAVNLAVPFGEYYGLFIPANTPHEHLASFDSMIKSAASSETFLSYLSNAGLLAVTPDRSTSAATVEGFSSITNWTLWSAGFLPTNPDSLGIQKP